MFLDKALDDGLKVGRARVVDHLEVRPVLHAADHGAELLVLLQHLQDIIPTVHLRFEDCRASDY